MVVVAVEIAEAAAAAAAAVVMNENALVRTATIMATVISIVQKLSFGHHKNERMSTKERGLVRVLRVKRTEN